MLRITKVRVVVQTFFLGLFLFFGIVTDLKHLKGWPVSLFLEMDPLVGIANAITTHRLYQGLLWSLAVILPTLILGRFFCNWVCPFGALHQFIGWLRQGIWPRTLKERMESAQYRPLYTIKYYILVFLLGAAVAVVKVQLLPLLIVAVATGSLLYWTHQRGCYDRWKETILGGGAVAAVAVGGLTLAGGTLQIGWLDPICLLSRSLTTAIWPWLNTFTEWFYSGEGQHEHVLAWAIGFILFFLLGMNVAIPRFFCRTLCPLGATLGILSRFSLWRIERHPEKCRDCNLCLIACEGASDPHSKLRKSECFVCFNCIEHCPSQALTFDFLPSLEHEVTGPELVRRRTLLAGLAGLLFFPWARTSGDVTKNFHRKVIRPPGSIPEPEFLQRCLKCAQCIRVCPTNVLQPAAFEAGVEGLWTPVLNMRLGYCELNCTDCGYVCPTGAIQRITLAEKQGVGEFARENGGPGPVKMGTAFYNQGRCLPWAMQTPCVVCQEVCPVSPKAIATYTEEITRWDGQTVVLQKPYIIPERCIGCGICEHSCPVKDDPAVYVTAIGETRSRERSLLVVNQAS